PLSHDRRKPGDPGAQHHQRGLGFPATAQLPRLGRQPPRLRPRDPAPLAPGILRPPLDAGRRATLRPRARHRPSGQGRRRPHLAMKSRPLRPLLLAALLGPVLLPAPAAAALLRDLYLARTELAADAGADDPGLLAAELDVELNQRRRWPKLEVKATELWVSQSIRQSGNVAFPSGREEYRARRFRVGLGQPLYDPTVRPQIEAARARLRQTQSLGRLNVDGQTRRLIEGFLTASRHHQLTGSTARVINRLRWEERRVGKQGRCRGLPSGTDTPRSA